MYSMVCFLLAVVLTPPCHNGDCSGLRCGAGLGYGDPRRLTHLPLLNCADSYVLYKSALMSYIRLIYAYMLI